MHQQQIEHERTIEQTAALRMRVLPLLRDYMARSGLEPPDFARRINYAYSTLRLFLDDKYHRVAGTHRLLCRAIEEYIAANPIEPPQQEMGDLYETENVDVIRETVELLLPRPMAYMLYGPPGSEKSFVLEYAVSELNRREAHKNGHGRRAFYLYADDLTVPQLWKQIAIACGSSAVGDKTRIARNLAFDFRNRRVLLVIDEAQHLDNNCLDSVRRLLDQPPHFSLLFAGSHDLKLRLDRFSAELGQLNSRIIRKVMLPGVSHASAEGIVRYEIGAYLDRMEPKKAAELTEMFIAGAIDRDAYTQEKGQPKTYINIRTLCNSLAQYKTRKLRKQVRPR